MTPNMHFEQTEFSSKRIYHNGTGILRSHAEVNARTAWQHHIQQLRGTFPMTAVELQCSAPHDPFSIIGIR